MTMPDTVYGAVLISIIDFFLSMAIITGKPSILRKCTFTSLMIQHSSTGSDTG